MIPHPEGLSVIGKGKAGRSDKILRGEPGLWEVGPFKMELLLPVRVELAVKELQAHLCRAQVVRFDPESDIFALCKAVVPFLQLAFEHVAVLLPDPVVLVAPDGDVNAFGEVLHIGPLVDESELHMDGRIKVIQEITISLKDLCLMKI